MHWSSLRRSDFDYWSGINTRWRDMDSLGHINHAVYLTYMESARVDVYQELGYSGIRKEQEESTILGSMEVNYHFQVDHPAVLNSLQMCSNSTKHVHTLLTSYIQPQVGSSCNISSCRYIFIWTIGHEWTHS